MIRVNGKKNKGRIWKRMFACMMAGCMVFNYAGSVELPVVRAEETSDEYTDTQGVKYRLNVDGTCQVRGYTSDLQTHIVIPEQIIVGGVEYGVTSIWQYAFDKCSVLTEVSIPKSVTTIWDCAFRDCSNLINVSIPESVTYIGEGAFWHCNSLTDINVAENSSNYMSMDGVLYTKSGEKLIYCPAGKDTVINFPTGLTTIDEYAFSDCTGLTSISLPEGVTSIGYFAFEECKSLTSVDIPESMISIGDAAFRGCSKLTNVVIPEGVTSIGASAFAGCSSLVDIKIPDAVTNIEWGAFLDCKSLLNINVSENNPNYMSVDGVLYTKTGENLIQCPCGKKEVTNYPENLISIDMEAFDSCSNLTDITIPKGVTSIGYMAFGDCSSLTSIILPEGLLTISQNAFMYCKNLTVIDIPESVTSIGDNAFADCSSLKNINVSGSSVNYMSMDGVLYTKSGDTLVCCPQGKTEINNYPEGLTNIGVLAFSGCKNLTSISMPESVTTIGQSAFNNCSNLLKIIIPESVINISEYAFWNCDNLNIYGAIGSTAEECVKLFL